MSSISLAEQWWKALIAAGASETQAAGIMGNIQNESGFNPEYNNPAQGVGGIQWIGSYLTMPGFPFPTGDAAKDITDQVAFLKRTGGFSAASGSTAEAAGQAFAMNYERCAECGAGGSQTVSRGQNASSWWNTAKSNKWPKGSGTPSTPGKGTEPGNAAPPAWIAALTELPGVGGLFSALFGGNASNPKGILSLPDSVAAIAAALAEIPVRLENLFKILAWLSNPLSWFRIIIGLAGIVLAAGGVVAMIGVF